MGGPEMAIEKHSTGCRFTLLISWCSHTIIGVHTDVG